MIIKNTVRKLYAALPFKTFVFSALRHLPLPQSLIKHLHFKGIFSTAIDGRSFRMRHYGYQLENEVFWRGLLGGWEKTSLKIWKELAKESEFIFDIGANTGLFSLVAKAINEKSEIFAFEPVKRVYERMVNNFELNNFEIHSEMMALSSSDGKAIIYDLPTEHIYSVTINENKNPTGIKTISTEVDIMKLDSYVKKMRIPRIDLIKMDVEGHEAEVVKGGFETFIKSKPAIIMEVLDHKAAASLDASFQKLNYSFYYINETIGDLQPKTSINCNCFGNFLACTSDHIRRINL